MISRRLFTGLIGSVAMMPGLAFGADMPAPFDNPGAVKIALVRYLSTGDFFQAYLSGVEKQAAAIGVDLRVLDSRQVLSGHRRRRFRINRNHVLMCTRLAAG